MWLRSSDGRRLRGESSMLAGTYRCRLCLSLPAVCCVCLGGAEKVDFAAFWELLYSAEL